MACELGVLEISRSELLKKDFEVLDGLLKLSGESFLLSDLLLPSESVFTVSDGSLDLEVSKLLLEETAKVVLFKAWGKVSRRELLEMELLLVSGILRCFAPPPIFTLETSEAGLICFLI